METEFTVRMNELVSFERLFSILTDKKIEPPPALYKTILYELLRCMEIAEQRKSQNKPGMPSPMVIFSNGEAQNNSRQIIWFFRVVDPNMEHKDNFNFHGHNTSQLVYGGAIVLRLNVLYGDLPLPDMGSVDMITSKTECMVLTAYDKETGRLMHQCIQKTSDPEWEDFTSGEQIEKPDNITYDRPKLPEPLIGVISTHH